MVDVQTTYQRRGNINVRTRSTHEYLRRTCTDCQGDSHVHKVKHPPQLSLSFPFPLDLTVGSSSDPACVRSSLSPSSCRLAGAGACNPGFKGARFLPLRRTISFSQAFSRRRSFASRSSSSVLPVKSPTVRSRLSVLSFFLTLNRAMGALSS